MYIKKINKSILLTLEKNKLRRNIQIHHNSFNGLLPINPLYLILH
jgi:excinuclease UvrABC helicase subunit UvrB